MKRFLDYLAFACLFFALGYGLVVGVMG